MLIGRCRQKYMFAWRGSIVSASTRLLISIVLAGAAIGSALEYARAEQGEYPRAEQGNPTDVYVHNDSVVSISIKSGTIKIRYLKPATNLEAAGVKVGTILVEGIVRDGNIKGKASLFSKRCGIMLYEITGTLSDKPNMVLLSGDRPIRGKDCTSGEVRRSELKFAYRLTTLGKSLARSPYKTSNGVRTDILRQPMQSLMPIATSFEPSAARVNRRATSDFTNTLNFCLYVTAADGQSADDKFVMFYTSAVEEYSTLSALLTIARYPTSIWQDDLDSILKSYINRLIEHKHRRYDYGDIRAGVAAQENALIHKLSAHRTSTGQSLLEFERQEYCGGDFFGTFKLLVRPAGGDLHVMSAFDYKFCQAVRIDASDERCDFWRRILPGMSLSFGRYRWRISWPDGRSKSDYLEIQNAHDDGKRFFLP